MDLIMKLLKYDARERITAKVRKERERENGR
jgi:hypothetical protein